MSLHPPNAVRAVIAFFRGKDPIYRERSPEAIVRMFVLVCMYYAVGSALISYWPAWRAKYHDYFRAFGDKAFQQFLVWPEASIRFLNLESKEIINDIRKAAPPLTVGDSFPVPQRDKQKVKDTLMLLKNVDPKNPGLGQLRTGSRLMGYWPTIAVVILALATPWTWKRKTWLLILVFVVVHGFIAARLAIYALQGGFAVPDKTWRLLTPSQFWFDQLKKLDLVINDNPTINFIAPVLIWLFAIVVVEFFLFASHRISASLFPASNERRDRSWRNERA